MKPDPQADIRARFRRRREHLGLTQAEMAWELGLSRLVYSGLETARKKRLAPEICARIDAVLSKHEAALRKLMEKSV